MFESRGAVLLGPARGEPEAPEWTDEELEERAAWHLADADPAGEDELWLVLDGSAEPVTGCQVDAPTLLSWAEAEPLATETVRLLEGIDPASLPRDDRLRLAALCHRLEARIDALKLSAIAAYAGPEPDPRSADGIESRQGDPDFLDCDVAVACRTSTVGGQRLVGLARDLRYRLAGTLGLLREGRVSHGHALAISELTTGLSLDGCAGVEQLVLSHAPDQSPGQFRTAVRRAVMRIDPESLTRREHAARTMVRVDTWHEDDGTGGLEARGPSVGISLMEHWVESYARAAKAAGDARSLPMLRFAGLAAACEAALAGQPVSTCAPADSRPTDHRRPVTVNLTIDLPTWLGLTDHPGEILGTDAIVPARRHPRHPRHW